MAGKKARRKNVKKKGQRVTSGKIEKQMSEHPLQIMAREPDILGKYCNLAIIRHTNREFVFDFVWGVENERILVSRIITSPAHAKELHKVLGANIERYEKKFRGKTSKQK